MKATKYVSITLIPMIITTACFSADKPEAEKQTDRQILVNGSNIFALGLYAKLRAREGNLFFSPYSISTALAMAYAGAHGETETQMAEVLHFPTAEGAVACDMNRRPSESPEAPWDRGRVHSAFGKIIKDLNTRGEKGSYELTVTNALWGQKNYGFLPEFLELIKTCYEGTLNEVDFATATEAARKTINAWVEKETKEKIKNLIPPGTLTSLTRLVLTNAIYFKGNWARQFEKDKTIDAPFTLTSGKKVNVPMMNQTAEFNYMETDSFQSLELPYVDNELSMIILLPKEFDGLGDLEKKMTSNYLSNRLTKLRSRKVIVSIPKFKMTSQFALAGVLKSMGMTEPFTERADFSGMNGRKDLFISAVLHKAYVDVHEEGTEAAAATGIVVGITSVQLQPPVFRADHPFVFLIRDNYSGSILFIGRMMNPNL